ncbi:ribosome rescue protein RqcH [Halorientalis marina]|uniref:ribosome rescue protein RqcH n=1 Tax=Halorientalis marina TaxID=2931976 RepID=UPI001FF36EDB|nr:ribosome rescue protein RqcH [Halorientalis marina]
MDRKRELTSVDLAALVGELRAYEGAKVDKAYLYDDGLLRFKMRDFDRGRVELLVDTGETKHLRVADPDNVPDAPGRPPNFAMMLRNRLSGADLVDVRQYEFDRIVEIEFDRGDDSTTVVVELFGDGNAAVLDGTGEVVDCLDTVRLKSRTVAPGSQYEFPSARFDPLSADYEAVAARLDDSDTDLVRTIATQLDFGGLWGEELCTRAGIEKTKDIDEATEDDYEAIFHEIERLRDRIDASDLDPQVYYPEDWGEGDDDGAEEGDPGPRVDVTPFPLEEHGAAPSEPFETFTAALDDYFTHFGADERKASGDASEGGSGGGRDRPDFESEIEKKERIIEQQRGAIEDFEAQAEAEREKAELLYAEYDLVDDILSTVQRAREDDVPWADIAAKFEQGAEQGIPEAEAVADVDGSEGTVTVELGDHRVTVDASMGVEKNADRHYNEAKRVEEKKEGAEAAIENTREELEAVKERREEWEAEDESEERGAAEGDGEGAGDEAEDVDWLSKPSIPVRQSESWFEEYRWFHTSDDFLVIGGRNADQNEELVEKYLDRHDRFFHAQAHGGPVTILKATGPSEPAKDVDFPETTLDEAAQFALSYSSVWKEGKFADDVYMVERDQVSKTPESGEYLEKGGFAIRGDRTYFENVRAEVAVGVTCEPETRVIGGPPSAIEPRTETSIRLEPGRYAQNDMAKKCYRELKSRFADESFVRKVASPDRVQEFLPPGGSRMIED